MYKKQEISIRVLPVQPQIFVVVTSAEILAIDRDGPFEVQTGSKQQCMYASYL